MVPFLLGRVNFCSDHLVGLMFLEDAFYGKSGQ